MTSRIDHNTYEARPGLIIIEHDPTGSIYYHAAADVYKAMVNTEANLRAGRHHNPKLQELARGGYQFSYTVEYTDTVHAAKHKRSTYLKQRYKDPLVLNSTSRPKLCGHYRVTHLPTGTFYVGASQDLEKQFSYQFTLLRNGKHKSKQMQDLWDREEDPTKVFGWTMAVTENIEEAKKTVDAIILEHRDDPLMANQYHLRTARKEYGAYILKDPITGMYYIGSTAKIRQRYSSHISMLKKGYHSNKRIQNLYDRGSTSFEWIEFPTETREEAYAVEQKLIDDAKNDPLCLNFSKDARSTITWVLENEEFRKKRVEGFLKHTRSKERREHHSKVMKKIWSDPERIKQRSGGGNPYARKVHYKGAEYGAITEAAQATGVSYKTIRKHLLDPKRKDAYYLDSPKTP